MSKEMHQLLLVPLWVFLLPVAGFWLALGKPEPLEPGAEQALDEAVQLLRDEALLTPARDWEALRRAAHQRLARAPSMSQLDEELASLVQALGDPHTSYQPPEQARRLMSAKGAAANAGPRPEPVPIRVAQEGRWPVLILDAFGALDTERSRAAALAIRAATVAAMARSPCGLMLDLRKNQGGNMYPMLMGVAPLLEPSPQQALLGFRSRRGPDQPVTLEDVSALLGQRWPHEQGLDYRPYTGRVAVLIGPMTASSGEMVAVAAQGRSRWRSFGKATAGYTTGNIVAPLSNGGLLALTTSRVLTRSGVPIQGSLQPDVPGEEQAPVAASRWLAQGCDKD
ncbi:S41 family peptidase [Mitsuaria sp. WAJ17]|uniref:S41 family peptidase n=1 Tax=Mitsuaria sp. WAJ17 TaxID=2761452 RepID=UPI0016040F75|nr:S41 family peptidase [Mitsuaria sp. WAJ17]MBB2486875.1 S41 family peptidase [Mitsuaria sp. WAJ17]